MIERLILQRFSVLAVALMAVASVTMPSVWTGTAMASNLLTPAQASRLGLTEAWRRQMQVPGGAQSIVDQQVHVIEGQVLEFVEVIEGAATPAGNGKSAPNSSTGGEGAISDLDVTSGLPKAEGVSPENAKVFARYRIDPFGPVETRLDKAEAERQARQQLRILERRGIKARITTRNAPLVRLYTLGNDGTLQCQDGESGELIWVVHVGSRSLGYGSLGVGTDSLTVINGSDFIRIDAANGNEITTQRIKSVPIHGAVHASDFSVVPTIRGGVECHPLSDTSLDPFMELVTGVATAIPTNAPGSPYIAWATDRGFVYFMELSGRPSVQFRVNTDGNVNGRLAAASGDRFFFGSDIGQVYAVHATRIGEILWNKPFGEPFYNRPLVHGDKVFIRSSYGSLFALNVDSGIMAWDRTTAGVDELIACFDDRLYVRMLSGVLAVIDASTGEIVQIISSVQVNKLLTNFVTNRLYLVDDSGAVQCLKPIGSDLPVVDVAMQSTAPKASVEESPVKTDETPNDSPKTADPFGAGASDPFGAGAPDPFGAGAGSDPFGAGGADPFGAGGAAPGGATQDPFGGDPFGN